MARVIWSDRALDQVDRIIAYVRLFDAIAARRIGDDLIDLGESLNEFPRRGRPGAHGTRELVTVPPYVLSYTLDGETVRIVAVRHGRQRAHR